MRFLVPVVGLAVPVLAAILASDMGVGLRLAAILAVGAPIGLYIALWRPVWISRALVIVLGAIPFAVLPGFPLPLVLLLAVAAGGATLLHLPRGTGRFTPIEWLWVVYIIVSTISVVVTLSTGYDVTEFLKWLIASSVFLSLARLPRPDLYAVGRTYVWAAAAGGAFGLVLLFFDRSGTVINSLGFLGYGSDGDNLRYVFGDQGATVRLTGTYVDPNAGGLFLAVGFALAVALLRGPSRWVAVGVLGTALGATQSRAAIFSVIVAVLGYFAFSNIRFGGRLKVLGFILAGAALAFSIPAIQNRILQTFDSEDVGANARLDALEQFPHQMEGAWLFGLGWGRIEFRDGSAGMAVNHVANAPLLTVYRGGVLVGLLFCLVLLAGILLAYRGLRENGNRLAFVGAVFVGLTLVALQLDFPIVTISPVATVFALLLAFLPRPGETVEPRHEVAAAEPVPIRVVREVRA